MNTTPVNSTVLKMQKTIIPERVAVNLFLSAIQKPSLLINALDDPFLSPSCFPYEEAKNSSHFYLMCLEYGGHGFYRSRGIPLV